MAIVVVQNLAPGGAGVGQGASVSYTPPSAFTPGNTILVLMTVFSTEGLSTSVTVGSNAATRDASNSVGTDQHLEIWRISNLPSAGDVTINWAGPGVGNYVLRGVLEVSGLENSGVVDLTPAPQGGTGTSPSISTSPTATDQADELVIALMQLTSGDATITQPGSYTSIMNNGAWSTDAAGAGAYRIVSATGTQTATWTLSASVGWAAAMVTYKAAAPPAVDDPPRVRRRTREQEAIEERPPRRMRMQLVGGAGPQVDQPPRARARMRFEERSDEIAIRARRLAVQTLLPVDPPGLGVWVLSEEPSAEERAPRRRTMPIVVGAVAAPFPHARRAVVRDEPARDEPIRLRRRFPESVDSPPTRLRRAPREEAAPDAVLRRLALAPQSVDAPPFARLRALALETFEERPPRRRSGLQPPAALTGDAPPLRSRPRAFEELLPDPPLARRGLVPLPSGAAIEHFPLRRWAVAFDAPTIEELPTRLRRFPESVDAPPLRVRSPRVEEPTGEEISRRLRFLALEEPSVFVPRRTRAPWEASPIDGVLRRLALLVPPPLPGDAPPIRQRPRAFEEPPPDPPLARRGTVPLPSGPTPPPTIVIVLGSSRFSGSQLGSHFTGN
jgi:hypothetical protein